MVQKHLVVDGLRFTYSGMFDINEFFKELDNWTDSNGFEREIKKKLEYVEADGKKMEYVFELWKRVADWARATVRIKALFNDVIDFDLEREGFKRNMQKGRVLIIVDGFLESDFEYRWQQKPYYVFLRTLYDKLIWKYWFTRYDGVVNTSSRNLFQKMHEHFKKYKY